MSRTRAALAAELGLIAFISACGVSMRTVRFDATPAAWRALTGEWRGEYRMQESDRHGSIAFKLVASAEQASGDVLMMSDRFAWPYQRYPPRGGSPSVPEEPRTQLLTIVFVRADEHRISGELEPYWDPDRRCRAFASFVGSVDGNTIRGTLSSVCEGDGRRLTGRWSVERKPATDARERTASPVMIIGRLPEIRH
jgi:hypothetical protein